MNTTSPHTSPLDPGRSWALSVLGYDRFLLAPLSPVSRRALHFQAGLWLAAAVLVSAAAAVAAWVAHPSLWSPLASAVFVMALLLNLLRLSVAGGGVSPCLRLKESLQRCNTWKPSTIPTFVFLALGMILSQPAQLLCFRDSLEGQLEPYRSGLIARHERAARALGANPEPIRKTLEGAGFPLEQLRLLWQAPQRAGMSTLFFCFLVVIPGLWARWVAVDALRDYQRARIREKNTSWNRLKQASGLEVAHTLKTHLVQEHP